MPPASGRGSTRCSPPWLPTGHETGTGTSPRRPSRASPAASPAPPSGVFAPPVSPPGGRGVIPVPLPVGGDVNDLVSAGPGIVECPQEPVGEDLPVVEQPLEGDGPGNGARAGENRAR